jgi:hypothetical protein
MNLTFNAFIKKYYGSQANMERQLGLGVRTAARWYQQDPRRFLYHLEDMVVQTGLDANTILEIIQQRESDLRHINNGG